MKIGFIGLGRLGKAMAQRLINCGHDLTVFNRTPGKEAGLSALVLDTPKSVAETNEITMKSWLNPDLEKLIFRMWVNYFPSLKIEDR